MTSTSPQKGVIERFLADYFKNGEYQQPAEGEKQIINTVVEIASGKLGEATYVLGLMLDFALLAQQMSAIDPALKKARLDLTRDDLFKLYPRVTERAGKTANTLSLQFKKKAYGIRKIEEKIGNLFDALYKKYPSAYVYNTGMWGKYESQLVQCFKLSESGRWHLVHALFNLAMAELPDFGKLFRAVAKPKRFSKVLQEHIRHAEGENGGLTLQAMAYGFIAADRNHLFAIADKVRTGSARQKRIGDIDCYNGRDPVLAVEVKDMHLNSENRAKEIGGFENAISETGVEGLVITASIDPELASALSSQRILTLTVADLIDTVQYWDFHKQERALDGMLHFLAHIEQHVGACERLEAFLNSLLAPSTKTAIPLGDTSGKTTPEAGEA